MAESKALILPTQWYEGFPMSIAEIYSVGIPVIGFDMVNVCLLIIDGVTGLRFPHNSEEGLIQVILKLDDLCERILEGYNEKYSELISLKL